MGRFTLLTCTFAAVLCIPTAQAADELADLMSTLSTAKAQTEGRAHRVQTCAALQRKPKIQELRSRYDTARNHFNGRIDAWLFSLKQRKDFALTASNEAPEINVAIEKVNDFVKTSDAALAAAPCATKVFWKEVVLGVVAVSPALIEAVKSFWSNSSTSEKEREALIVALEQYRISEWGKGQVAVAFNLEEQTFIPFQSVTDDTARLASTAIYVNKWTIKATSSPDIVSTKLPPTQLSKDYILFTGSPSQLQALIIQERPVPAPAKPTPAAAAACPAALRIAGLCQ